MSNTDRARILRRRAAFIGSALAAMGCPPQSSTPTPDPVVTVPTATATSAAVTATPTPSAPATAAPAAGDRPSLDIPDDVGKVAKRRYESYAASMKELYTLQDQLQAAIADDCSLLEAKCDARWQQVATIKAKMRKVLMFMHSCHGSSADAKRFADFEKAHRSHFDERQAQLEERIQAAIASAGKGADERWATHLQDARKANPTPCLKFACVDW